MKSPHGGSTSTLMINEKAKLLKNEINSLDSEIVALQMNLKTALKRKEASLPRK